MRAHTLWIFFIPKCTPSQFGSCALCPSLSISHRQIVVQINDDSHIKIGISGLLLQYIEVFFVELCITFAYTSQNYKGTKLIRSILLHRHLLKRTTFNMKTHHLTASIFSMVDIILSATTFNMFYKSPLWFFYFPHIWFTQGYLILSEFYPSRG